MCSLFSILFCILFIKLPISQNPLTIIGNKNITHRTYRIPQSFLKLSIYGPFYCHVTWIDDKQNIDVYTDNNIHPYVIITIEEDTLKIVIQSDTNIKYTKMDIYLNLYPTIRDIFLAGISTIHSTNLLKIDNLLKIHTEDTSSLILQLDVIDLDALFLSAGITKLTGHVNDQAIIKYYGTGNVDASQLFCKFIDVNANGLGTIWITGIDECMIKAEGVSIVRYNCFNITDIQSNDLAKVLST